MDGETINGMNNDNDMQVDDGVVVTLDYTLTVEGEVVDTSEGTDPIQFIQGMGHIITGLEDGLYGMKVGESKQVHVPAAEGYGETEAENVLDIPREEFPDDIPLEPGVELQLRNEDGETVNARIHTVEEEFVTLDFNHPLAGKDLNFAVTVVDLRLATQEEMDHGHVHEGHDH